ncbi:MAG: hypothetical protein ABL949_16610, partial [Fimbriimonadaceae bacterium]
TNPGVFCHRRCPFMIQVYSWLQEAPYAQGDRMAQGAGSSLKITRPFAFVTRIDIATSYTSPG